MKTALFFFLIIGLALVSNASSAQTEVVFKGSIAKKLDALNAQEQRYEERFRRYRHIDRNAARSTFRLNKARFFDTEWAGERLIDNVEEFTAENLLKALVDYNLKRLPEGSARPNIRLTIEQMRTQNNSIALLDGAQTYMIGTIEVFGADGSRVESFTVSTNYVQQPSVSRNYDGPELFYFTTDPTRRIGPLFTQFVAKGLSKIYPDVKFARALVATDPVNF